MIDFCNDGHCPAVANINIKICGDTCAVKKYHKDTNKLLVETKTNIINKKRIMNKNYKIEEEKQNQEKDEDLINILSNTKISNKT